MIFVQERRWMLSFLLMFCLLVPGYAQVEVKRSDTRVSIGGTAYYVHIVETGQTLYSIARAYSVPTEVITRENTTALYTLTPGQALKIPVDEVGKTGDRSDTGERNEEDFIYHTLRRGETIYSLSKKYDIPEEMIRDSNPELDIFDIPEGTVISIPRKEFREPVREFSTRDKEPWFLHKIESGETLSSIARKYAIQLRELRQLNDGVRFLRPGTFLRIPRETESAADILTDTGSRDIITDSARSDDLKITTLHHDENVEITPVENLTARVKVSLLLPLFLDENSKRSYIDSSSFNQRGDRIYRVVKRDDTWIYPRSAVFLEFYEGALIAIDDLRRRGLTVELSVFDTRADINTVRNLLNDGVLDNSDLVIGPVYNDNVRLVAEYLRSRRMPVVSPLAAMNSGVLNRNPYLFKVQPSRDVVESAMARTIADYYDHNIIFVHNDSAYNREASSSFRRKIVRELRYRVPADDIRMKEIFFMSRSVISDKINIIDHAMRRDQTNLIVLASDNEAVMSEVLGNVHSLSKRYKIKVIGYPEMRWLSNLDPSYFYDLGIAHHTPGWVDYNRPGIKEFIGRYRELFKTEPHLMSYAWQGYDIAFYFISGVALNGSDFKYRPSLHHPGLLQVDYDFRRNGLFDGYENNSLYLIRYNPDLTVRVISDYENQSGRE
ncbi:MAG: LysM peptidoglycan-binding domain-containing protein [Bacteroidales bacterium]|nr:LysM peptidoglycan-binding domain-containing protein [Bacteroidales bacterium]